MANASLGLIAFVRRLADRNSRAATDRQLLERFDRERDQGAFAELVGRHGPMVLAACQRVLRHEQDAEDAFQATFLVLARKAARIRQSEALAGWLYQVAHRLAVRAKLSSVKRQARFTVLDRDCADRAAPVLDSALEKELERLPEQYRTVFVLCCLEGRTQKEAAQMLATTADAVNSRLKRGRDLLRRRLCRAGFALSAVALAEALTARTVHAALPAMLIQRTVQTAFQFLSGEAAPAGVSSLALSLALGASRTMITTQCKLVFALVLGVTLLASGALWMSPLAAERNPALDRPAADEGYPVLVKQLGAKKKARLGCILLWMNGGPSQMDTFDPKPGDSALFKAIDTSVKGMEFAETLPKLAKEAHHLTLIRSLNHRNFDHARATHVMRTGYEKDPAFDFPSLGCVLAKELGDARPGVPRYLLINSTSVSQSGVGPGFLGKKYRAVGIAGPMGDRFPLPTVEVFEALDKDQGKAQRNAVAKAFDLTKEKVELRNAYGRGRFGQGCLLARRLIECGVPVVEVNLSGWDAHSNAKEIVSKRCADLDAGFATLVKDLHERGRLDSTLIVCMGEFGRSPVLNRNGGRDHHPLGFTVVLAGAGIKGGQTVGKTSADGASVAERPVSPQEFLATIYQVLGVDATKKNRTPTGQMVPLVENGQQAVKEALR